MSNRFRDLDHFRKEVLLGSAGPMSSAAEEIADELYHQEFVEEFDSMWDSFEEDDE